jgi:hypothetical protein
MVPQNIKIKEPLVLVFRKAQRTYTSHERTGKDFSLGFFFFWVLLDGSVVNIRAGSLIFQGTVVMKPKNRRDNHQGVWCPFLQH